MKLGPFNSPRPVDFVSNQLSKLLYSCTVDGGRFSVSLGEGEGQLSAHEQVHDQRELPDKLLVHERYVLGVNLNHF